MNRGIKSVFTQRKHLYHHVLDNISGHAYSKDLAHYVSEHTIPTPQKKHPIPTK